MHVCVAVSSQTPPKPPTDQLQSPAGNPGAPAPTTSEQLMASLPLALDPVLNQPISSQLHTRRTLGDNFDERIKLSRSNFATSIDNKIIFACGFWDNSFRVFQSDSGKLASLLSTWQMWLFTNYILNSILLYTI